MTANPPPPPRNETALADLFQGLFDVSVRRARRIVDDHPELRRPDAVNRLVMSAGFALDDGQSRQAERWYAIAGLLIGNNNRDVANLIAQLVHIYEELTPEGEPEDWDFGTALLVIHYATEDGFLRSCHPNMAAGVLHMAAALRGRYGRFERNPDTVADAVDLARMAVAAGQSGIPQRVDHLIGLAERLRELFEITADPAHLLEATKTMRMAAAEADPNSLAYADSLNTLSRNLAYTYEITGDRSKLEESIAVSRRAVDAADAADPAYPVILSMLSARLRELYQLTLRRGLLDEAVDAARAAVDHVDADDPRRPGLLTNLAGSLGGRAKVAKSHEDLDQAIAAAREALDRTVPEGFDRPDFLHNLAALLGKRFDEHHRREDIDEAIRLLRDALDATPVSSARRPVRAANLATRLAARFEATGDDHDLEEARRVTTFNAELGYSDAIRMGETRAYLARQAGDVYAAIQPLQGALEAFRSESERLRGDRGALRELATHAEGLISNLASCHAVAGDVSRAREVLEAPRVWLPRPGAPRSDFDDPATVWVCAGDWETVILSTHLDEPVVLPVNRFDMGDVLFTALDEARRGQPGTAVSALVDFTSRLTERFPDTDALLIAPTGFCGLLPFAAGRTSEGTALIERAAITVAPSAAWAAAAHRDRPEGGSFGVFHPGPPSWPQLHLGRDRSSFAMMFGRDACIEMPTAADVLRHLNADGVVAHFSCHGSYDALDPMSSGLELEDRLSLRAVLQHQEVNWLVNLSACESGIPDLARSEQMISFPTAFLLAGASHVIGTLWSVGNVAATTYNERFYEEVLAGMPPAAAHRDAVLRVREMRSHALWWAAFTHYGSPG